MDYQKLHEQLQDEQMEDERPSISHGFMNQQTQQVSHEAELCIDPTLQADQVSCAQIGVNPAPNEFLDQQARQGVYGLQASVEATSQTNQESHAQSVVLGPNRSHQVSTSRQRVRPPLNYKTHAQLGVEIPVDAYKTSKYLHANGLSPDTLEAYIESTVGSAYDPLWYQRIGIIERMPTTSPSLQKLTDFFRKVFQIGDQFGVYLLLDNQWTQRYATVKSFKPDTVFIEPSHNGSPGIHCKVGASLRGLYNAIVQEHTGTATATYAGIPLYTDIHVYRQGVNLGNLATIRQWHHLWSDDFDLWAVKTGNFHLRQRRRLPSYADQKSLTWSKGLWFERFLDGTFRACANQLLFGSRTTYLMQAERKKLKEGGV